jgi:methanogenic corrinoid protein MtbC1
LEKLKAAVIEGKRREAEDLTRRVLDGGTDPQEIIQGTHRNDAIPLY